MPNVKITTKKGQFSLDNGPPRKGKPHPEIRTTDWTVVTFRAANLLIKYYLSFFDILEKFRWDRSEMWAYYLQAVWGIKRSERMRRSRNVRLYKVKRLQGILWNFQENSFWKIKHSVHNEIRFNAIAIAIATTKVCNKITLI